MPKIIVKQTEPETPTEVIASAIEQIATGIRALRAGRLNDKALVLLIQYAAPSGMISQREIKIVLAAIDDLERTYLKKKS